MNSLSISKLQNLHFETKLLPRILFSRNGNLLLKLFRPTVRKNCSTDREKLLKFDAEGWKFTKILRSLEQFFQTVKGQNNFLVKFILFEKGTKFEKNLHHYI